MAKVRTFDKNGWAEKTLPDTEGVVLGCECGQYAYFALEEVTKSQSQEKYYFCDCVLQQVFYVKIVEEV